MPKRSKEFKELLRQESNSPINRRKRLDKFMQEIQQGPLGEMAENIIVDPVGEKKMSEVLIEFVKPYYATVKNAKQYNKLLKFAAAAWNTTFLSEEDREEMIDKSINEGMKYADAETKKDALKLFKDLIARKNQYFADEHRLIMDFKLNESDNQYHLSVASAVTDKSDR